jgi:hypothetical protein
VNWFNSYPLDFGSAFCTKLPCPEGTTQPTECEEREPLSQATLPRKISGVQTTRAPLARTARGCKQREPLSQESLGGAKIARGGKTAGHKQIRLTADLNPLYQSPSYKNAVHFGRIPIYPACYTAKHRV